MCANRKTDGVGPRHQEAESVDLMNFGLTHSIKRQGLAVLVIALMLAVTAAFMPRFAFAQDAGTADAATTEAITSEATLDPAEAADGSTEEAAPGAGAYTPMKPTPGKGLPVAGGIGFQDQYSEDGEFALWMHDSILLPLITAISLFVLGLLLWVVMKFRRGANPTPSKTTHNTLIEVVWTLVPVLILVAIAIPSITLLARQYEVPPKDAVTIKVTGYQWYWGYTYPDNGGFEVISNMLTEEEAAARGEPHQLAVDNRMVVPAGVPLRIQTTGADVIHSFAVPSLWFKIDAVPGRVNERLLVIDEPGVYYGQCSELCGARHAYMPITVEALPMAQYRAWVLAQGGSFGDEADSDEEVDAAPLQQPESAIEGAPGAGAPPVETAATTA